MGRWGNRLLPLPYVSVASDAERSSKESGPTLIKKEKVSKPCSESDVSLADTDGLSLAALLCSGTLSQPDEVSLKSASALSADTGKSSTKASSPLNRIPSTSPIPSSTKPTRTKVRATRKQKVSTLAVVQRVTLLRYGDSGTSAVWTEGGEDTCPVIGIDLHTSIDLMNLAQEVATEKAKDNENKARYIARSLTTQSMAEYAYIVWIQGEGTVVDLKQLKYRMEQMKYMPPEMGGKNGWSVTIMGNSDYHSDLIVDSTRLHSGKAIFVHAVRFGTNDKVILKGWTTAKYIKLIGSGYTKEFQSRGRSFGVEKYSFNTNELFPMSLLRVQLEKKRALDKDQTTMAIAKEMDNEFGF